MQVLTVCVTHLLLFLGETEPNTEKHTSVTTPTHINKMSFTSEFIQTDGVSPRQRTQRFMWPCQRQVNSCYTGPFPRATQTQLAVSSIRRFHPQRGELEPLINAGRRD